MRVTVSGIDKVKAWINSIVPRGMKKAAMYAISEYIIGNSGRGLKHEPAYKYVSRKSAYGMSFFTEKQRRWFWANGGPAMIGNHRTHTLSNDWDFTDQGAWTRVSIFNQTPYAGYVMGDSGQARQPAKVGWKKMMEVIRANMAGALRAGQTAVNNLIASKGR